MLRQSAYNLVTPVAGGALLTNLLSRQVMEVPDSVLRFLESVDASFDPAPLRGRERRLLETLLAGLYVVPADFDEWQYVRARHRSERDETSRFNLIVAPTMGCNMGCHYCFQRRRDEQFEESRDGALVGYVADATRSCESLHVQWFGGEPLLALADIRRLSRKLAALMADAGKPYSAEVITNGFLLTEAAAKELAALGVVDAQFTLEGMRRTHDRVRKQADGTGSFDRIVENMVAASRHLAVTLRVHVAPYSLESVLELLPYLAGLGLQRRLKKLYFSPLFNYRAGLAAKGQFALEPRKFMGSAEFAAVQTQLLALAKRLGFPADDPLDVSYGLCTGVKTASAVVNPDGSLAKCYLDAGEADAAHGAVDGSRPRPEKLAWWHDYDFSTDEECRSCKFAPVCLGGCPKQNASQADKRTICTPLKFNFHDRMRLHYGEKVPT
jgi:uncharacterized protein